MLNRTGKIASAVLIVTLGLSLTGCGTRLTKLTPDEEKSIVAYSAAVVSKYNKNQKKGYIRYQLDDSSKKDKSSDDSGSTDNKENNENPVNDNQDPSSASDAGGTDSGENANNSSNGSSSDSIKELSLNDAIGIPGVTFNNPSTNISQDYKFGDYVSLTPKQGCQYIVCTSHVVNNSGADVNLDMRSLGYTYYFTINGTETAQNENTILLNDLATYQATLKAGEETDLVLLFQFKQDVLSNMQSQSFEMTKDGQTIKISL
jgi:uncharacterized protein YceK